MDDLLARFFELREAARAADKEWKKANAARNQALQAIDQTGRKLAARLGDEYRYVYPNIFRTTDGTVLENLHIPLDRQ